MAARQKRLDQVARDVVRWHQKEFRDAAPAGAVAQLAEEVMELAAVMDQADDAGTAEELADCFILLVAIARLTGVDLAAAAQAKLEVNKGRTYGPPDEYGIRRHVKGPLVH